jgi:LysM repeat protein
MKNIITYFCLLLLVLSSCKTRKNTVVKANSASSKPKYTAESYIDRFKDIARAEMKTHGIPASIKLAQALLESGSGNSDLAMQANNHFGIKCNIGWKGKSILKDDDEKDECFRVYDQAEDSFKDHSEFLKKKRYEALFKLDKMDYVSWAKGLKEAGYATNPKYPDLLIGIIERYQLQRFDEKNYAWDRVRRTDEPEVVKEEVPNEPTSKSTAGLKIYEVKSGDTLYSIAVRFGMSVLDLKSINSLHQETVYIGQLLIVSK